MERKQLLRIGVRLTTAIIEILQNEFSDDKKARRANETGKKKVKASGQRSRKNSVRGYGFNSN
jgi:hypothetical protein